MKWTSDFPKHLTFKIKKFKIRTFEDACGTGGESGVQLVH